MSSLKRFSEQFEFPELSALKVVPAPRLTEWDIIGELRARLRKAQAAQFRAEASLAIVREERDKLAARLKELAGSLYKLWRAADGANARRRVPRRLERGGDGERPAPDRRARARDGRTRLG